jgi:hypothetical protein
MICTKSDRFSHHEPCPRCGSRDNLGRWEDGHAWCFGCRYSEPPRRSLSNVRPTEANNNYNDPLFHDDPPSFHLPPHAVAWLKKYGITDKEIEQRRIKKKQKKPRLVLPFVEGGEVVFFQGRYFGSNPKEPRFRTFGRRKQFHVFDDHGDSATLVLVEDYISAIKVGRVAAAYPILGAHVPEDVLDRCRKRFERFGIWLDADKTKEASKAVLRGLARGLDIFRITTPKDPKEYNEKEIYSFINSSRNVSI